MEPDFESALRNYLQPGERLRWTGRPAQGLRLTSRDIFLIPFSLMWGGFAIVWEAAVIGIPFATHAPPVTWFMALWGVPFVTIGLYMMVGRFFADAWARARIGYAVTDRRVLVLRRLRGERLIAAPLGQPVQMQVERNGRGTISVGGPSLPWGARGWSFWLPAMSEQVQFVGIEDVMSVYRMLDAGQAAAA